MDDIVARIDRGSVNGKNSNHAETVYRNSEETACKRPQTAIIHKVFALSTSERSAAQKLMYVIRSQSIKIHKIFDTNWFQLISQKTRTDGKREIVRKKCLYKISGFFLLQHLKASFKVHTVKSCVLKCNNFESRFEFCFDCSEHFVSKYFTHSMDWQKMIEILIQWIEIVSNFNLFSARILSNSIRKSLKLTINRSIPSIQNYHKI